MRVHCTLDGDRSMANCFHSQVNGGSLWQINGRFTTMEDISFHTDVKYSLDIYKEIQIVYGDKSVLGKTMREWGRQYYETPLPEFLNNCICDAKVTTIETFI